MIWIAEACRREEIAAPWRHTPRFGNETAITPVSGTDLYRES
jgi:hypothetical protein